MMLTNIDAKEYIARVEKSYDGKPEVDLVLMAMFFGINLIVLYVEDEVIKTVGLNFGKKQVTVYINPEGYFDMVYEKSFVKNGGICQSIILDVFLRLILAN